MKDVIIAPTASYHRTPDQIPINDSIQDQTDAIHPSVKPASIMTQATVRGGPDNTVLKSYYDMRMIHTGSLNADNRARQLDIYKELTKKKNMTYFPVNDNTANSRYMRGLNCF